MMYPTIHTNGTGRDMLMRGYLDARIAVLKAMNAIQRIEFNARDYYPQGPDAWPRARDEHSARLKRLHEIEMELLDIAMHIQDAGK